MYKQRNLWVSLLLIGVLLYFFLSIGFTTIQEAIPMSILHVNTIFLSIVLEALPFVFLGVFTSALIQTFVAEGSVRRFIPKNPVVAIVPAVLVSAIFPVCECAIIPVVRRLMKKGMPLHIGVIFIVGAPILNPIVFASTYYAFQFNPGYCICPDGIGLRRGHCHWQPCLCFLSQSQSIKMDNRGTVGQICTVGRPRDLPK